MWDGKLFAGLSCRKVNFRCRAPPLTACTKAPIRPAASGASKGASRRLRRRSGGRRPGQGAACGEGADLLGVGQLGRVALGAVPVVALHVVALAGDHRHDR